MGLKGTRTTPVSEMSILFLAFLISFLYRIWNRIGEIRRPRALLPPAEGREGGEGGGGGGGGVPAGISRILLLGGNELSSEGEGERESARERERERERERASGFSLARRFVAAEEWITKLRALAKAPAKVQRDPELEPRGIREGTISSAMLVGIWSRVDWSSFRVSGEINARILTRADLPIDALG